MEKVLATLAVVFIVLLTWSLIRGHAASVAIAQQQAIVQQAQQQAAVLQAQKKVSDQARDAAQAEATGYKADAERFLADANAKGKTIAALQAKLKAMGPQAPAADPGTLPVEPQALAAAYANEGFPPTLVGTTLGWPVVPAREMLGLVQDGKQYPAALVRIDTMGQEITLHEAKETDLAGAVSQQTARGEALDTALADAKQGEVDCEGVVAQKDIVIAAEQEEVKDEAKKGFWHTTLGAGIGIVVGVLLHLL